MEGETGDEDDIWVSGSSNCEDATTIQWDGEQVEKWIWEEGDGRKMCVVRECKIWVVFEILENRAKTSRHVDTRLKRKEQSYLFICWELDCQEIWMLKNWCFWTVVLEKTLESPLDCKEIQPVHSEGDQSWVFFERMMLKLKLQYFGHLMRRVDSLEKTLMLEGLGAGGQGNDRGWDGWMASPTRWMLVWVNSRR